MNIFFRVDASLQIGTGHVVRCLTLAKIQQEAGATCKFICRKHEGNLIDYINKEKFEVITLKSTEYLQINPKENNLEIAHEDWLGVLWEEDARQTIEVIYCEKVDLLVIDHYGIDQRWEKKLRPYVNKIMVIDDLADRNHECDIILDQNLVANFQSRYNSLIPSKCIRLFGPEYALLQAEYAALHPSAPPRTGSVKRILIFFGGVDLGDCTGLSLSAFLKLGRTDIQVDVVISKNNPHAQKLRRYTDLNSNIHLYESLPTLAYLMLKADLAIGGGGATSWERCALGLPTIVVSMAENQKSIAEELDRRGLAISIGCSSSVTESLIISTLKSVLAMPSLENWSQKCLLVTDGCGSVKVKSILMLNIQTPLFIRSANLTDERFLLNLSNDFLVRKNAFSSDQISSETHNCWFYSRLRDPENSRIFIVETSERLPIGQVRFERDSTNRWELHYAIVAFSRGCGLARPMLEKSIQRLVDLLPIKNIFAKVKKDNITSLRVFANLKFDKTEFSDYVVFTKKIISADCKHAN